MQYALLAYSPAEETDRAARPIPGALATLFDRPSVTGWARLHAEESATTLRNDEGRTLLTDGPFIDSKEYLGGRNTRSAMRPSRSPCRPITSCPTGWRPSSPWST